MRLQRIGQGLIVQTRHVQSECSVAALDGTNWHDRNTGNINGVFDEHIDRLLYDCRHCCRVIEFRLKQVPLLRH